MNSEKQEFIIQYDNNDIEKFEKLYDLKAIYKNGKPNKKFVQFLKKDDSKIVKKTVVELENMNSDNNISDLSKVRNMSYEQPLIFSDFDKQISELIKLSKDNSKSEIEQEKAIESIKSLMKQNISNQDLVMNTNIQAQDINAQNKLLDTSENYLGFVYFFWSAETMNFKIIGLHTINPIFDFVNVKQSFYLIKPAMITNDTPIYFCFDKIPYSISFDIQQDLIKLTDLFITEGTTSDIFYFLEKNKNYIRIYGFNKIPNRVYLMFLLVLGIVCMFEYILLSSIFSGGK